MKKRIVPVLAVLAISLLAASCREKVAEEIAEIVSEELVLISEEEPETVTSIEPETSENSELTYYELADQDFDYLDITPSVHEFKDFGTVGYISRTLKCTFCDGTVCEYYGEYIDIAPKYSDKADIISQTIKDICFKKYTRDKENQLFFAEDSDDCNSLDHGTEYAQRYSDCIIDIRLFGDYMAIDYEKIECAGFDCLGPFVSSLLFDLNTGERIDLAKLFPGTLEDYKKIVTDRTVEYFLNEDPPELQDWVLDAEDVYSIAGLYVDTFQFDVRYEADGVYVVYPPGWLAHTRKGLIAQVFISYEELGIADKIQQAK